jgi:hypothetical protein
MGLTRRFHPAKYYKGLTRKQKIQREKEIKSHSINFKNPKAYTPFKTDAIKTKPSQYTRRWNRLFPNAKSLEARAAATGVPLTVLKESYNRGMAAWRTGHRPGATQQQWGYARVSSFLLCGKTHYTADSDLVRKTRRIAWWRRCPKKMK